MVGDASTAQLLSRSARAHAARIAIEGPQGTVTFAELADRVARVAAGLRDLGLSPGDRVLDLQPNQNTSIELDLATSWAGLVRVHLNHRLHERDWARIAEDSRATALVYDARYAERAAFLRDELPHVSIGDGPGVSYAKLAEGPAMPPEVRDLVSLNYTSGTTGAPKGVRREHSNRLAGAEAMAADVVPGLSTEDTYLHAGPITHTSGLFVLPFLAAGARQLILGGFDTGDVLEAAAERGATHTALVPTMIARLLADPALDRPLPLKMLAYAGAPMPPAHIRDAFERLTPHLVQYYGLVEAIPPITVLSAADHREGLTGRPELLTSAGRAATGVELRIVGDTGETLPPGEVGEVTIRGRAVMSGYWSGDGGSRPIRDGWLHTGDLGRVETDGHLYLVDRKGDMIITGGYNVYPREVEEALSAAEGVDQVAVVGLPDPEWGQRIVAYYTGRAQESEVDAHARRELASYKKPKEYRRLDAFPLNSTGKIDKKALRGGTP
ncbi:AMP-binding protein [Phytomonospora sp. NPDC050363]|uniref:class I adenylate-forming enzyme family protein n=1 Tax=Phytomonospora sp. NPDC050363 TaxID=3155642 RepID=UPI0033C1BE92